jgi:hypothetical protein
MNDDNRIAAEQEEKRLVEIETDRFRDKIQNALGDFKEVRFLAELAGTWQPIVRMRIKAFFYREYSQEVSVTFDPTDPNAMMVRARNRPRRQLRVAVSLEAQN